MDSHITLLHEALLATIPMELLKGSLILTFSAALLPVEASQFPSPVWSFLGLFQRSQEVAGSRFP